MRTRSRNTTPLDFGYSGATGGASDDHPRCAWRRIYGFSPPYSDALAYWYGEYSLTPLLNWAGDTIVDELSPRGKQDWNACTHEKVEYSNPAQAYLTRTVSSYPSTYGASYPPSTMYYHSVSGFRRYKPNDARSHTLPSASLDLVSLREEAMSAMYPGFSSGFDAFVSIVELRELKSVMRILTNLHNGSVAAWASRMWESDSKKTLAELHLTYGYAVRPMIKDLSSLCNAVDYARKRLDDYVRKGLKGETHHFSKKISETISQSNVGDTVVVTTKRVTYHAQAEVSYVLNIGEYERMSSVWELFGLAASGVRIWNLIPFSFVVDGFFGVSKWLEALQKRNGLVTVSIGRTSETIVQESIQTCHRKREFVFDGKPSLVIGDYGAQANSFDTTYMPSGCSGTVWSNRKRRYSRTPGVSFPTSTPLPQLQLPSVFQGTLFTALAWSLKPRAERKSFIVKPWKVYRRKRFKPKNKAGF